MSQRKILNPIKQLLMSKKPMFLENKT